MARINRTGLEGRESYLGFTFGGVHSSELQIVRVYDSRFSEQVLPGQSDRTIKLPNSDKTVYYGRNFEPMEISVGFAYDDLSEKGKRKLKQTFASEQLQELTFDEEPYKTYLAKVSGQPTLNFVPFDDLEYGRVYRGEGEVTFFIPNPLAYSKYKRIDDYGDGNKKEWEQAYSFENETNKWVSKENGYSAVVYNNGDVEAPFKFYFNTKYKQTKISAIQIISDLPNGKKDTKTILLNLDALPQPKSTVFCFDSELQLIYGVREDLETKTGEIANSIIAEGVFTNLPVGESEIIITNAVDNNIAPINKGNGNEEEAIEYKYWYY